MDIEGLKFAEEFITPAEEVLLLENINKQPWNASLKRRTQHYGFEYDYQSK